MSEQKKQYKSKSFTGQRYFVAGFDDEWGVGISVNADNISIKKAKKLYEQIGKVIKYLEAK
jgi:hypothetical protein